MTNADLIEKNWAELKRRIQSRWTKLSDLEIDGVRVDLNQLTARLEKSYGLARDAAEEQLEEFKLSLGMLIGLDAPLVAEAPARAPAAAPQLSPARVLIEPLGVGVKPSFAKVTRIH
jgi:hypothetical protein